MIDPITSISPWIGYDVFSYLNTKELANCSLVSKQWKQYTDLLWTNAIFISETEKWRKYCFSEIGEKSPLPSNIREILNSPCPIWPGKKIFQTHILGLVPKTVSGYPFNLEHFLYANKVAYRVVHLYGRKSVKESYWVLMTRDVLPGTEGKSYEAQKICVEQLSQKAKIEYQVPSILEAMACIFASSENLYTTPTRCIEKVDNETNVVVCTGQLTGVQGCAFQISFWNSLYLGVGAVRMIRRC